MLAKSIARTLAGAAGLAFAATGMAHAQFMPGPYPVIIEPPPSLITPPSPKPKPRPTPDARPTPGPDDGDGDHHPKYWGR